MKKFDQKKTIYLIDGSSFLYRAYYAMRPLNAPNGSPVQAVYGFCRMIKKIQKTFEPDYFAVIWDSPGKTVRHELYDQYKATRDAPPSDLFEQKKMIQEFIDLVGLHQYAQKGIEADDLMASIASDYEKKGYTTVVVTSDKDLCQIVTEKVEIFDPFKDTIFGPEEVEKKYGFPVDKLPFYFALLGDASDNIPGVKGIGPKGAQKLVQNFDSLEDVYARIEETGTARTQKLLLDAKEHAFLSEKLFLIHYYKTGITLDELVFEDHGFENARSFFEKLNFKSLLKEMPAPKSGPKEPFSERYGYDFVCVTDESILQNLCKEIQKKGYCALDTETDSLRPLQSRLVGISLCCKEGQSFYIPIAHDTGEYQLPFEIVQKHIKPLLEDSSIKKFLQNAKFDMLVLHNVGIELKGLTFDTMIAAGLVRQDGDKIGLKSLSERYFNESMFTYKEMVTDYKFKSFAQVPLHDATDYAAADAHQTYKLVDVLRKELKEYEQEKLYESIELPLVQVLYEMEREGIHINLDALAKINKKITKKLDTIIQHISDLTGKSAEDLNLNSSRQVGDLLFNEIGLEPVKKTAKKTGYSTDQSVLKELAKQHPVPGLIVRYRELFKLKSTYLDALGGYVNPKTGNIHTTYNQSSVATGRLSSTDPNLQNIPADGSEAPIRQAFEAQKGFSFISADYSQMELRVLAQYSQDRALLDAFNAGEDIHARTAAGLFKVALEDVSYDQRQIAKRINFSILYGLTPYGLSKDLGISVSQAKEYIETYMSHYPGVSQWMDEVIQEAKEYGYVTTWFGRRRPVPEIYEKNRVLYQLACRIAINTKAQGTAAELMKLGMLQVDKVLTGTPDQVKMLLQIHDELLIVVPDENITKCEQIVQNALQTVVKWDVPLEVSIRHGKTWHDVSK